MKVLKVVITRANQRRTPPGRQIDSKKTMAAARAVTEAAGPFLRRLNEWRVHSLEQARSRFIPCNPCGV